MTFAKLPKLNQKERESLIGQRFKDGNIEILAAPRYALIDNVEQLVALCNAYGTLAFCSFSIKSTLITNVQI